MSAPYRPPRLERPPSTTRTYAHVRAFDAACPGCGAVSSIAVSRGVRRRGMASAGADASGYDPLTGHWKCRRCARRYVVGVIFWALTTSGQLATPGDHVPSLGEASELRQQLGHSGPIRRVARDVDVNRVCTCASGCLVHGAGASKEVIT